MAESASIRQGFLSDIESERRKPSDETLRKIRGSGRLILLVDSCLAGCSLPIKVG
ncbi:hypothetical protein [Enterovirga rhinocerotis]|uniref:hypothetical protein n=1 Tax=Enterovirga rhinocerotis TaxID=1339210 RepID=UPI003CCAE4F2